MPDLLAVPTATPGTGDRAKSKPCGSASLTEPMGTRLRLRPPRSSPATGLSAGIPECLLVSGRKLHAAWPGAPAARPARCSRGDDSGARREQHAVAGRVPGKGDAQHAQRVLGGGDPGRPACLRTLHPPATRIAIICDNFSPHLTTKKDARVGGPGSCEQRRDHLHPDQQLMAKSHRGLAGASFVT